MAYDKVLSILKARGIKKAQLAKACEIPESVIYNLFAGRQYLYPKYRAKISAYLGVDPEELFNEE